MTSRAVASNQTATATHRQASKNRKYAGVASRLGAEMLNLSLETCGGMASDAVRLVKAIGEEGERWSAGTWSSGHIERMLLGSIAVAVQRGNALAMLSGFSRMTSTRGVWRVGTRGECAAADVSEGGDG